MGQTLLLLVVAFVTVIGVGCLAVALDDLADTARTRRPEPAANAGGRARSAGRRRHVGQVSQAYTRPPFEPQLFARSSRVSPDLATAARLERR